jgi:nitroreductase
MDAMNALLARRSIRKYTDNPVSDGDIQEVIKAAMEAPSAGNEQPWHFVIMDDRKILDQIPSFHPHSQMVKSAPVAILVCGDLDKEKHKGYWTQDCSAATQNLLLAVHAKGLGAVWVGVYPRDERVEGFRNLLNIPENVVPFSLVPIGHPAEEKPPGDRHDPSRIHTNGW